jgi:CHASE2 domain-containing sensor protein
MGKPNPQPPVLQFGPQPGMAAQCLGGIARHFKWVVLHHPRHWLFVGSVIVVSLILGYYLEHDEGWLPARYRVYWLFQHPWPRPLVFRDTVVVILDDDAYWDDAGGDRPLNRAYLADLVDKLASQDPAVIGLDIFTNSTGKFRTTLPNGKVIVDRQDRAEDSAKLLDTLEKAANSCDIVLSINVQRKDLLDSAQRGSGEKAMPHAEASSPLSWFADGDSERLPYVKLPDYYDEYGLQSDNIVPAYLLLYPDRRAVPPRVPLEDGREIPSLSLAAAERFRPELVSTKDWSQPRFGSFVNRSPESEISAHQLMIAQGDEAQALARKIRHKIVLVGGDWHEDSSRVGRRVDQHPTPIGELPGVVLHANYVEAILDDRAFDMLRSRVWLSAVDVLLGLLFAYVLFVPIRLGVKVPLAVLVAVVPLVASLVIMQYFAIYWDSLIMSVLLLGHFVSERMIFGSHHH